MIFLAVFESDIRESGIDKKSGSGIRDKHPGSAKLDSDKEHDFSPLNWNLSQLNKTRSKQIQIAKVSNLNIQ